MSTAPPEHQSTTEPGNCPARGGVGTTVGSAAAPQSVPGTVVEPAAGRRKATAHNSDRLPEPAWTRSAEICLRCNYSLHGLAAPGLCPECGTPYVAQQLLLAGVAKQSRATPLGRRLAWAAVGGGLLLFALIWPLLLMFNFVALLIVIIALVGGLIALLVTGRRERRGTERFVITPAGIARIPLRIQPGTDGFDSVMIPWDGSNCVQITRISTVWRSLRIGTADSTGRMRAVIFDAGFRCPDAAAPEVEAVIKDMVRASLAARDPATAESVGETGRTPP